MAGHSEIERLESLIPECYSPEPILEELTRTYTGDPLFLVELKEFIDTLDQEDKSIIYLRYFGLTIEEVAQELKLTERRIEQRIKGIRERARRWVG